MDEIMKEGTPKFEEYERLVLYRDSLLKECTENELWYYGKFGELLEKHYSLLVECVELKKRIAFCQAKANRGLDISLKELEKYISREMKEYQENLKQIKEEVSLAKTGHAAYPLSVVKVKEIYRKIAKKIHPDIHPELYYAHEEIADLWHELVDAYSFNDYHAIVKIEIQVNKLLKQWGYDIVDVDIPNIDELIENVEAEIIELEASPSFAFKELREDKAKSDMKKLELENDIKHLEEYKITLIKQLETYTIGD